MEMEEKGKPEEAIKLFLQAWDEATHDLEKFIAAHYVAQQQDNVSERLIWLQKDLQLALQINDYEINGALPPLYLNIAHCYAELGDLENVKKNLDLAKANEEVPTDKGPFYHGTKANLKIGDLLLAGGKSNYKDELLMNHIYFTAIINGAGLAAALAKGDDPERVYIVEPTGIFENDPNVTNKKFPGNPSRSYRSTLPLKITGEVTDWERITSEQRKAWQKKLAANKGEIIN